MTDDFMSEAEQLKNGEKSESPFFCLRMFLKHAEKY